MIHCNLGTGQLAEDLRQDPEDETSHDGSCEGALAPGDDHDDHGHRVDEQEHIGIDDPDIVGVEAARGAGHGGGDHGRQDQETRHVHPHGLGQGLVLARSAMKARPARDATRRRQTM